MSVPRSTVTDLTVSAPIPFQKVWLSNKQFHFLILWEAPFKWWRWNTTLRAKFKHSNSAKTANTTSFVATKYSNLFKPGYILLILKRNQLPSVVREGTEAGAAVMEQGVNLLASFPLSSPFFYHYGNMRTSSKTHKFRGKTCSKNNSLREWVDSRVQQIWRLQVIGSRQRLIHIQLIQSRVYFFVFFFCSFLQVIARWRYMSRIWIWTIVSCCGSMMIIRWRARYTSQSFQCQIILWSMMIIINWRARYTFLLFQCQIISSFSSSTRADLWIISSITVFFIRCLSFPSIATAISRKSTRNCYISFSERQLSAFHHSRALYRRPLIKVKSPVKLTNHFEPKIV